MTEAVEIEAVETEVVDTEAATQGEAVIREDLSPLVQQKHHPTCCGERGGSQDGGGRDGGG